MSDGEPTTPNPNPPKKRTSKGTAPKPRAPRKPAEPANNINPSPSGKDGYIVGWGTAYVGWNGSNYVRQNKANAMVFDHNDEAQVAADTVGGKIIPVTATS